MFIKHNRFGKLIKFFKHFIKLNVDIFFQILKIYEILKIFLLTEQITFPSFQRKLIQIT
jgi:hypothetical protein